MAKALENRIDNLERSVHSIEQSQKVFERKFDERGQKHEKYSQVMAEYTSDYLRFTEANSELAKTVARQNDEISRIKTEAAFSTLAIQEFKDLGKNILNRMDSIEKTIAAMVVRDSTFKWIAKFILQATTFAGILIGIIKYFMP